jgi:predicted dehydrogenase
MGHLPWIWEHPQARLVAVCDSDPGKARQAADRWQAAGAATDYREVLARRDVDAVCICTPPGSHAQIAQAAARAGKHILLEKPMARSVGECQAMIDAARGNGVLLMIGHEKRFNTAFGRIREIVEAGLLGRLFSLSVHWGSAVKLAPEILVPPGYRENYEWRWKDTTVGGGILQDHLPHYADLWRWWTGSEVATVCTEMQNVTRDYLGNAEIGAWEDYGSVLMRFADGTIGSFETGTVGRGLSPILHNGSGLGEWSEFGYVLGTRGHLAFDLPPWDSPENGRIMVWSLEDKAPRDRGWYQVELPDPRRSPGGPLSPATNEGYMFRRQLDHFIRCIIDGREPSVSGRDGLATLAVVEAAYESARTGCKVAVSGAPAIPGALTVPRPSATGDT